jgi:uncharacterized protein YggE
MSLKPNRFLPALVLLLAAAAPGAGLADEAPKRSLTLAATGAVKAPPDQATISTGITSEAPTAREALDKNSAAMAGVVAGLKDEGIEPKDIQTTNFSVQPVYEQPKEGRPPSPRVTGYRVTNSVRVVVHDTGKLGSILDKVVSLGANDIGGIEFDIAEPEKLKDEARKRAVAEATATAKLYAEAAGVALGDVLSISEEEGGYQPRMAAAPMEMSKAVPIEAGTATVEVRVR